MYGRFNIIGLINALINGSRIMFVTTMLILWKTNRY